MSDAMCEGEQICIKISRLLSRLGTLRCDLMESVSVRPFFPYFDVLAFLFFVKASTV